MAIAYVIGTAAQSSAGANITSSSIDTTGANLLLVGVGMSSFSFPPIAGSVTDNKSNTFAIRSYYTSPGDDSTRTVIYQCAGATVGSGHTFTYDNGHSDFPSLVVGAFSGADVSPNDGLNGAGGTAETLQTGSVTPSQAGDVLFTAVTSAGGTVGTRSIDGGFTIIAQIENGSLGVAIAGAYLIQGAAAAANPTWSWTTARPSAATLAAYKAGGGGGGAPATTAFYRRRR